MPDQCQLLRVAAPVSDRPTLSVPLNFSCDSSQVPSRPSCRWRSLRTSPRHTVARASTFTPVLEDEVRVGGAFGSSDVRGFDRFCSLTQCHPNAGRSRLRRRRATRATRDRGAAARRAPRVRVLGAARRRAGLTVATGSRGQCRGRGAALRLVPWTSRTPRTRGVGDAAGLERGTRSRRVSGAMVVVVVLTVNPKQGGSLLVLLATTAVSSH